MSCPCTGTSAIVSTLAVATLISAAAVGFVRSENMASHNRIALSQASPAAATAVIQKVSNTGANLNRDGQG